MKDKKKVGLIKRISAGVCALVVVVSSLGVTVPYYASSKSDSINSILDMLGFGSVDIDESYSYIIYYDKVLDKYKLIGARAIDYDIGFCISFDQTRRGLYPCTLDWIPYSGGGQDANFDILYDKDLSNGVSLTSAKNSTLWSSMQFLSTQDNGILTLDTVYDLIKVYYSDLPVYECNRSSSTLKVVFDSVIPNFDSYNSSLGYLQNIQRKNLTLDGESYDPDYDSWQVMFTFDSKTTTGLDITSGGYSVRHFMNWEVRDKDSNIIRTYDKVSCGEYDATSCKISYPLYSSRQDAMSACEFVPLSWWESGVLGYKVYIYDYLQLVRTNADGSVEYGGYVRIDDNGYVADTLDDNFTEDPNGYLDQDVSSSNGSGSNYEDAEHDADKNADSSSESSESLLSQINLLTSVIKAVPELIMEVFRFLPEWCLDLVATAFALSIIITIYKLGN